MFASFMAYWSKSLIFFSAWAHKINVLAFISCLYCFCSVSQILCWWCPSFKQAFLPFDVSWWLHFAVWVPLWMWESPQSCESVNKFNSPYYQHQVHLILLEMSVDHFAFSVGTVQDFQNLHKRNLFVNEHNILIK